MFHDRFRYAVIAAAYAVSIYVFISLPRLLAVGGGSAAALPWFRRGAIAFFFPTAALVVLFIFKALAAKEPYRANYDRFRRTFDILLDVVAVLLVGVHFLLLGQILGVRAGAGRILMYVPTTLVGLLLIIVGNVMPRLRPNSAMGIRTPWTLGDERVWAGTHRVGGYLLVLFGMGLIVFTYIDFQKLWWVFGPGLFLSLVGLPVYSYALSRRLAGAAQQAGSVKGPGQKD